MPPVSGLIKEDNHNSIYTSSLIIILSLGVIYNFNLFAALYHHTPNTREFVLLVFGTIAILYALICTLILTTELGSIFPASY
jgi:hypothetical protein